MGVIRPHVQNPPESQGGCHLVLSHPTDAVPPRSGDGLLLPGSRRPARGSHTLVDLWQTRWGLPRLLDPRIQAASVWGAAGRCQGHQPPVLCRRHCGGGEGTPLSLSTIRSRGGHAWLHGDPATPFPEPPILPCVSSMRAGGKESTWGGAGGLDHSRTSRQGQSPSQPSSDELAVRLRLPPPNCTDVSEDLVFALLPPRTKAHRPGRN